MASRTRIVLVDDHQIIRDGLRLLLRDQADLELVGNAYDATSGWQTIEELRPDLVVMDLNVPGDGGGAGLTERVRGAFPETKVLVLTAHSEPAHVRAALRAGADGYVLKGDGFLVLLHAIRTVLGGKTYLCPEMCGILVEQIQQRPGGGRPVDGVLSPREVEVLRQLADGRSTKEIAFHLGVSGKTIESHRVNVMNKLQLGSVAELTKYALRHGLTSL